MRPYRLGSTLLSLCTIVVLFCAICPAKADFLGIGKATKDTIDKIKPQQSTNKDSAAAPPVAVTNQNTGGRFDLRAAALQTAMETTASFLSEPGLRKKLDGLRAKPAMDELRSALENNSQSIPAKFFENLLLQGGTKITREELKRQVVASLQASAEKAASASMPSKSFKQLCEQMRSQLALKLKEKVLTRYTKAGPRFVLAGGTFDYRINSAPGSEDPRLEDALKNVMLELLDEPTFSENFHIVRYDVSEAEQVIEKFGGSRENWMREDGRNQMDIAVRDYHPADIFVVTGKLIETVEDDGCKRSYQVIAVVDHPMKRSPVTFVKVEMENLYHPTKGWLTTAEDAAIGAQAP